MADKEVAVTAISVKMGSKVVSLSVEEAKKLKDTLVELFGGVTKISEDHHHWHFRDSGWWYSFPHHKVETGPVLTDVFDTTPKVLGMASNNVEYSNGEILVNIQ